MDEMAYYEMIDLYKSPHHFGRLDDYDLFSEESSESCSDSFSVYIKTLDGKVRGISFQGSGCVISTVSLSKLCDFIIGKEISIIKDLGLDDIKRLIGIDKISTNRINCALIGLETVKKAVSKRID